MGDQAITLLDEYRFMKSEGTVSTEVLFREHHERVFLASYRVTGNVQDAEDVLQSIFLRLLKRSGQQNLYENPGSYLCRAAINSSLDILRAKRRMETVDVDDSGNEADASGKPADHDVRQAEIRRQLRLALLSLNPRAAEVFALRYFEDFSNSQIAEMLETSNSSIAVTLHRTRDRLQELLREFEGESL